MEQEQENNNIVFCTKKIAYVNGDGEKKNSELVLARDLYSWKIIFNGYFFFFFI